MKVSVTVAGCCPPPPGSRDPEHGASGGPDLGRPRASGPRVLGGGWRGAVPACPDPAGGRGHLGGPCSTVGITGVVPGAGRAGSCPALLGGAYQNKLCLWWPARRLSAHTDSRRPHVSIPTAPGLFFFSPPDSKSIYFPVKLFQRRESNLKWFA